MKKFIYLCTMLGSVLFINSSNAQFSAQNDAKYIATLRAVVDYKINDEEIIDDVESLRQNKYFVRDLQRKLDRLSNSRTKTGENRQVYQILLKAGKDLDRALR